MTEKRDLLADLEICQEAEIGPWSISDNGFMVCSNLGLAVAECESKEDALFISESREGWPEALNRAIAAEAEVEKLKSTVVILESLNKGLDIDCNELTTEVERLQEDNALLQIINSELVTIAKNYLNYIRSVPIAEGEGEVIKWVSEVLKRCRRDTDTGRS